MIFLFFITLLCIVFQGHDTVTYTTLWCLFLLGLYPEVQEKAFLEIQLKTESYVTYEDSCNLTYLESVIKVMLLKTFI